MTEKEKFIQKSKLKFGNKFNYNKFNYTNAKTKSIIICPEHGEFEQNPDKHLTSKYGCQECSLIGRKLTSKGKVVVKPLKYTWEKIKTKLFSKFPNYVFICDNYSGTQSKIKVICTEHGETTNNPHNLLHENVKTPCKKCGNRHRAKRKTHSYEELLTQMNTLYNYKYTYSSTNYINKKSKLTITCELHGDFIRSAQKHLSGQGCPHCTIDALILEGKLPGGYCETIFNRSKELQNKKGVLYYVKIGNLYKIGITTNLENRIKNLKSKSKEEVIIVDTLSTTLYKAYKIEQKILETYKEYRISTKVSTELFTKDILLGKILK